MPTALDPVSHASPITILAVDDNPEVLTFLEMVLQDAGYRVLRAEGGRNAVEVYESYGQPIDLLLTDVIMPDLTGPVVAQRIRARQPDLPVLFISGHHDADLLHRFVKQKGFALLPKPFTTESLLRGVNEALKPWTFVA
jgi:two-component system, cell cycle sensor histidine kinase and response regulator CckA